MLLNKTDDYDLIGSKCIAAVAETIAGRLGHEGYLYDICLDGEDGMRCALNPELSYDLVHAGQDATYRGRLDHPQGHAGKKTKNTRNHDYRCFRDR